MNHVDVLKAVWKFMNTIISEVADKEGSNGAGALFDSMEFYSSAEILKAIDDLAKDLNIE